MPISRPIRIPALLAAALLAAASATAQDDRLMQTDPCSILTEEALRARRIVVTSIADMEAKDVREAPAYVEVITARQFASAGARDLMEALQLVPGISLGRDVDDAIGVALHGNWAEEGKCLFLLNGYQLNENDFGTYTLGMRVPLENVDRIEVILGPGSIVHGGFAALGVVNIVTYTAEQRAGARASWQAGATAGGLTRNTMTLSGAHRLGTNQDVDYLISNSSGRTSNASYALPNGTPISLRDSTATASSSFQVHNRWKGLKAFMAYMDRTHDISDAAYSVRMRDAMLGAEQDIQLGTRLRLQWRIGHTDQLPWYYIDSPTGERLASNTF